MKRMILSIVLVFIVVFGTSFALNETAYANAQADHLEILKTVLPGTTACVVVPYDGDDANIRSIHKSEVGYIVETVTYGYAGEIRMLVGVNFDGKVQGLVVREAHETMGLGSRILTDHVFLSQFLNKTGSFEVATQGADAFSGATGEVAAEGESVQVDGISGATVSSKAVVRCVNSAIAYVTGADSVSAATSWGG